MSESDGRGRDVRNRWEGMEYQEVCGRKGCHKKLVEEGISGRVGKEGMSGRLLREEGTLEEREGMGRQAVWGRKEFLERVCGIRDIGKGWKRRNVRKVIATGKEVICICGSVSRQGMECQEEFDRNGSQERLGSLRNVSKGFDKKGCQKRLKTGKDVTKGFDRKGHHEG
jgi:hypothetical protein